MVLNGRVHEMKTSLNVKQRVKTLLLTRCFMRVKAVSCTLYLAYMKRRLMTNFQVRVMRETITQQLMRCPALVTVSGKTYELAAVRT